MGARKTHLDISIFTLGGTSYLADLERADFKIENVNAEAKGVAARHAKTVVTKRRLTFSGGFLRQVAGARQTNLNLSVFSVGATDVLADVESGTLKVETKHQEGAGQADEWTFPCSTGTEISVSATLKVASAAAATLFAAAGATIASLAVTLSITIGGMVFVCPFTLTSAGKQFERDGLIMCPVELRQNGTPTTATGNTLLVAILTGSAVMAYSLDDSVDAVAGNALMTSATVQFNDSAIVSDQFEFENQGTPTFT